MKTARIASLGVLMAAFASPSSPADPSFLRGEVTSDSKVDLSDAIATLGYLFLGGPSLSCLDAADANDDGKLDITDPILLLSFLFTGGKPLPFPAVRDEWGPDPAGDGLDCEEYRPGPLPETRVFSVGPIADLEVFPDGRRVALGGSGVGVLDIEDGTLAPLVPATLRGVTDLALSPDGRLLAVAGLWRTTLTVWDAETGALFRALDHDPDQEAVFCAAFSGDGTRLLTIQRPRHPDPFASPFPTKLWVWDIATGMPDRVISRPDMIPRCAAFSPSGDRIIVGGDDLGQGKLCLLDAATGEAIETESLPYWVVAVTFSPDGRRLAVGIAGDGASYLEIWDPAAWEMMHRILCPGHFLAFSPDSRSLVASGMIVDVDSGTVRDRLVDPAGFSAAAFVREEGLVTGSSQGPVRLWDIATGASTVAREDFSFPDGIRLKAAFSPDGGRIAVGAAWEFFPPDAPVRVWETGTGRLDRTFETSIYGPVTAVERIGDGPSFLSIRGIFMDTAPQAAEIWGNDPGAGPERYPQSFLAAWAVDPAAGKLLLASYQGNLALWKFPGREKVWEARVPCDEVLAAWCSGSEGRVIAKVAEGEGYRVEVWGVPSPTRLCVLEEVDGRLIRASFLPDGDRLVLVDFEGIVRVRDAASGGLIAEIGPMEGDDVLPALGISPDGSLLAVGAKGEVKIYNLGTFGLVKSLVTAEGFSFLHPLRFSPDLSTVAAQSGGTGDLFVWDLASGAAREFSVGNSFGAFDYAEDGTAILAGDLSGDIAVMDRGTGEIRERLRPLEVGNVGALAFSPDGTHVATGNFFWEWEEQIDPMSNIRFPYHAVIWDAGTGKPALILSEHDSFIQDVAYSPGGDLLATFDRNGKVRLWDAATGSLLRTAEALPLGDGGSVAFSADGARVLAGSRSFGMSPETSSFSVLDASTLAPIAGFAVEYGGPVVFSRDGAMAMAGKKVIDPATGGTIGSLSPRSMFAPLGFVPGSDLVLGIDGGLLALFDRTTGGLHQTLGRTASGAGSPDGSIAIGFGGTGTSARLWSLGSR